jgi:hypothetical protein
MWMGVANHVDCFRVILTCRHNRLLTRCTGVDRVHTETSEAWCRVIWLGHPKQVGRWTERDFAAWIGLVSRQESAGGKQQLGPISKQGDR